MTRAPALALALSSAMLAPSLALGDPSQGSASEPSRATLVDHPDDSAFFVGGQANAIYQYHPTFPAAYDGPNSLPARSDGIASYVLTLYLGALVTKTTELFLDGEMAAGGGIGSALGLAGFTNLDVVRNPTLGSNPYVARLQIRQTIPLSHRMVEAARGHLSMATRVPETRLEIRAGKISTADFFDVNAVGSDSHRQFMNWTSCSNGAYDYAADTRGYTYGAIITLESSNVALRLGEMLMPTVANGLDLDWHLDKAHGDNLELELRPRLIRGRSGALRLLGYANHANMGSYREAIDAFQRHEEPRPTIEAHRKPGRVKYGVGLNLEQELTSALRVFARAGWNEGAYESFAFTEVNDTVALGGDLRGEFYRRADDKIGLAFISNGISADHRRYLALGGRGFVLGDGALRYGRETIVEAYYDARLYRGVSSGLDVQLVANPGYNRDRGPVAVFSARGHIEF